MQQACTQTTSSRLRRRLPHLLRPHHHQHTHAAGLSRTRPAAAAARQQAHGPAQLSTASAVLPAATTSSRYNSSRNGRLLWDPFSRSLGQAGSTVTAAARDTAPPTAQPLTAAMQESWCCPRQQLGPCCALALLLQASPRFLGQAAAAVLRPGPGLAQPPIRAPVLAAVAAYCSSSSSCGWRWVGTEAPPVSSQLCRVWMTLQGC
jgi:hypothetical protein